MKILDLFKRKPKKYYCQSCGKKAVFKYSWEHDIDSGKKIYQLMCPEAKPYTDPWNSHTRFRIYK